MRQGVSKLLADCVEILSVVDLDLIRDIFTLLLQ